MVEAGTFAEPVRILSDLHLGHPGSRISSVEQLRPLLEGAGTVIFNGDTLELRAKSYRPVAERFFEELKALMEELGVRGVFLTGNHDPEIGDTHHVDLCGDAVLVTHGDVLYPEIAPWSVRTREARRRILAYDREIRDEEGDGFDERLRRCKKVCEMTAIFKPKVKAGFFGRQRTLLSLVWPPWKPLVILWVWWRQKHLAAAFCEKYRPQAKCIIFGHTHYTGIWRVGGRLIVNTGGYVSVGRANVVEFEGNEIRVYPVLRRRDGAFEAGREPSFRTRVE